MLSARSVPYYYVNALKSRHRDRGEGKGSPEGYIPGRNPYQKGELPLNSFHGGEKEQKKLNKVD